MTERTLLELDEIAKANGKAFAAALEEMIDSGFGELDPAMPSRGQEPRNVVVWEDRGGTPETPANGF